MLNMWRKWKGVNLKRRASITLREWSDQRLVPLVTFSLCFYSLRTQTLWEAAPLGLMVILFSTSRLSVCRLLGQCNSSSCRKGRKYYLRAFYTDSSKG